MPSQPAWFHRLDEILGVLRRPWDTIFILSVWRVATTQLLGHYRLAGLVRVAIRQIDRFVLPGSSVLASLSLTARRRFLSRQPNMAADTISIVCHIMGVSSGLLRLAANIEP